MMGPSPDCMVGAGELPSYSTVVSDVRNIVRLCIVMLKDISFFNKHIS